MKILNKQKPQAFYPLKYLYFETKKAMKIELENAQSLKIKHPQDTYEIIRRVFYESDKKVDLMKEHLWAISLNKSMRVLNIELVSIGCKDRTIADPGEIFRVPLYKSSNYIILVHNHPSETLQPSEADLKFTNRIIKAGHILDIEVIDHVIVTRHSFYSFEQNGKIEELNICTEYALSFIYEKRMARRMEELKKKAEKDHKKGLSKGRREGKEEGREQGRQEGARRERREIAIEMLKEGVDDKKIVKITGLTRSWLSRLKNELAKKNNPSNIEVFV